MDEVDVLFSSSKEWRVFEFVDRRVNVLVLGFVLLCVDVLK